MSANGKRLPAPRKEMGSPLAPIPPQDELIKFICDSWNKVCQEYQKGNAQGTPTVTYHMGSDPNPLLKDFVPFDLEAYWGQRFMQTIATQNVQSQ